MYVRDHESQTCQVPVKKVFVNFTWALSTGCRVVLWPCSFRKTGDLQRNSLILTGVLTLQPPPVMVMHFFKEGSTDLVSKEVTSSSGKCSSGSQVLSAAL